MRYYCTDFSCNISGDYATNIAAVITVGCSRTAEKLHITNLGVNIPFKNCYFQTCVVFICAKPTHKAIMCIDLFGFVQFLLINKCRHSFFTNRGHVDIFPRGSVYFPDAISYHLLKRDGHYHFIMIGVVI